MTIHRQVLHQIKMGIRVVFFVLAVATPAFASLRLAIPSYSSGPVLQRAVVLRPPVPVFPVPSIRVVPAPYLRARTPIIPLPLPPPVISVPPPVVALPPPVVPVRPPVVVLPPPVVRVSRPVVALPPPVVPVPVYSKIAVEPHLEYAPPPPPAAVAPVAPAVEYGPPVDPYPAPAPAPLPAYAPPPPPPPPPEPVAPVVDVEYGPPSNEYGPPSNEYGPPSNEYGAPITVSRW